MQPNFNYFRAKREKLAVSVLDAAKIKDLRSRDEQIINLHWTIMYNARGYTPDNCEQRWKHSTEQELTYHQYAGIAIVIFNFVTDLVCQTSWATTFITQSMTMTLFSYDWLIRQPYQHTTFDNSSATDTRILEGISTLYITQWGTKTPIFII